MKYIDINVGIFGAQLGIKMLLDNLDCLQGIVFNDYEESIYKSIFPETKVLNVSNVKSSSFEIAEIGIASCTTDDLNAFSTGTAKSFENPVGYSIKLLKNNAFKYFVFISSRSFLYQLHGHSFAYFLNKVHSAGYNACWKRVNATSLGLPHDCQYTILLCINSNLLLNDLSTVFLKTFENVKFPNIETSIYSKNIGPIAKIEDNTRPKIGEKNISITFSIKW